MDPKNKRKGFTLYEILVAVTILGLTLGAVLESVSQMQRTGAMLGDQARKDGWRHFVQQAGRAGIDPANALVFAVPPPEGQPSATHALGQVNATIPALRRHITVDRDGSGGTVAVSRLLLQAAHEVSGMGFIIGRGAAVPSRTDPLVPLTPILLTSPVVSPSISPAVGSRLTLAEVTSHAGGVSTVNLAATATAAESAMNVFVDVAAPASAQNRYRGVGSTGGTVSLLDLASPLNARAWVEYPGRADDTPVVMSDGLRTLWRVRVGQQWQEYVPSELVGYDFRVSLGAPVLVHLGTEYPATTQIQTDWYDRLAIESGAATSYLNWPQSTIAHFGGSWPLAGIFFSSSFAGTVGPGSGDLGSFFSTANLSLWQPVTAVTARPILTGWLVADGYNAVTGTQPTFLWTYQISRVALSAPARTTAPAFSYGPLNTFLPSAGISVVSWGVPTTPPPAKPYTLNGQRNGAASASLDAGASWIISTGPDVAVSIPAP